MLKLNYVSNLKVQEHGGGWSAMNRNVYQQLKEFSSVHVIDDVNPPMVFAEKLISKAKRIAGLPSVFPAFSAKRLAMIAQAVESKLDDSMTMNFFHGSTPWVKIKNKLPYACYLDATFATYLSTYHDKNQFDVRNVLALEKKFLQEAKAVFFSSQWSLEQAKSAYNLPGSNFHVAGLGGNLPDGENFESGERKQFVFIGLDFAGKGGNIVADAFRIFSKDNKGFKMKFVGGSPPATVLEIPGAEYVGYLDKRKPEQLNTFRKILLESVALILPTNRDITPLVIIEAGYLGCPSIASNAFGIPEIIGKQGYLCKTPVTVDEVLIAMNAMKDRVVDTEEVASFYRQNFTWENTGRIMKSVLT